MPDGRRTLQGAVLAALGRLSPYRAACLRWEIEVRRRRVDRLVLDALIQPGSVVVDVGAGTGAFAARFAQKVGVSGRVFALEPNPASSAKLQRVARGRSNLIPVVMAGSDAEGEAFLRVPVVVGVEHRGLGSLHPNRHASDERSVRVRTTSLDRLVPTEERRVSLIKVDVEGHELDVLRGAGRLIERFRPALFVEVEQRHHESPIEQVFDSIAAMGYSGWAVTRSGLLSLDLFDKQHSQLNHLTGTFQDEMPADYVNDFLFLAKGSDPPPLLAPLGPGGQLPDLT
jgi:FkbM family methyltransferase